MSNEKNATEAGVTINNQDNNQLEPPQPLSNQPTNWTLYRGVLISFFVLIIAVNSIFGFFFSHGNVPCIYDFSFEKTAALNQFFADNKAYKNVLLIISSLCLDINLIVMAVMWTFNAKSWRCLVTLLTFYGARGICQVYKYY